MRNSLKIRDEGSHVLRPRSSHHGSALAAFLSAAALVVGCAGDATEPAAETTDGLTVVVETASEAYESGQPIEVAVRAVNRTAGTLVLEFSSGQRYDFWIEDETGQTVWQWSAARSFIQVVGSETVAPDEELVCRETVDIDLEPGDYVVAGAITTAALPRDETAITVR